MSLATPQSVRKLQRALYAKAKANNYDWWTGKAQVGSIRSFVFRVGLFSSFGSDLPRRGSAQQFPPSRGVMGARSPHSKGVSLIC